MNSRRIQEDILAKREKAIQHASAEPPLDSPVKVLLFPCAGVRDSLLDLFRENGCSVQAIAEPAELFQSLRSGEVDVVLFEYSPDEDEPGENFRLVRKIKDCSPATEIIVYHPADAAISLVDSCEFIMAGVRSFVKDGDTDDSGAEIIRRVRDCAAMKRRNRQREIELDANDIPGRFGIIGNSPAMRKVFDYVQKAAVLSDAPVLITGESGTGKQLLAQAIHSLDEKRRDHPFVVVNCSAITPTLAESELFGHHRGAFTGSTGERLGYFRAAHKGTIFLDEISEMHPSLQPKLLRVLQESLVMPVGGDEEEEIDVRVIAATNRDLGECITDGTFRLDLFQRLNVIPINVPPLQSRKQDIPLLIRHFINKHAGHYRGGKIERIDSRVIDAVAALDSEGNVRQLENLVRHVLLTKETGDCLELSDLPRNVISKLLSSKKRDSEEAVAEHLLECVTGHGMTLQEILDYCERLVLDKVLALNGHNQTKTAQLLGTTPRTVFNKIRKHT